MNDSLAIRHCLRPVMRFKRDMARSKKASWNWGMILCLACCVLFWTLIFLAINLSRPAGAEEIDLHKIQMIESSGNPLAHRKADDSIGLYQITPICLKEFNNFHPGKHYAREDLWDPKINKEIADWYLNVRIPQMIKHYDKPDTIPNRITAYNAGIVYLKNNKDVPSTTKLYICKYQGRCK